MTARIARSIILASLAAAAVWAGGLVWFVTGLDDFMPAPDTATDAIVVLTGGKGRMEAGLELLEAGKGKKLLVSGVRPGVSFEAMAGPDAHVGHWLDCCIVLGHAAENTVGNAAETARWLREENFHSMRLVTANYHMRRALLEYGRVLPGDVLVVPNPVDPGGLPRGLWRATSPVVVMEYTKYLGALTRKLLGFGPEHPA